LRPRLIERLKAGLHRKLTPMRNIGLIIRPGRLWQDHTAERVGRWPPAAGELQIVQRLVTLSHFAAIINKNSVLKSQGV